MEPVVLKDEVNEGRVLFKKFIEDLINDLDPESEQSNHGSPETEGSNMVI